MTIRTLPAAAVLSRANDVRAACPPRALKAWNPGVRAVSNAAESDNSISILDVIGEDWWTGEGVTAKRIAGALRSIGERDVVVNINSPGGDYFEGLAIYNLLREHPGQVTVKILGIAASAASVIAMAGDQVQIARAGFLMIHNTWVVTAGDRHALRATADWLEPFDATAVDIYAARSGLESKAVAKMLDDEAWIGGADAVAKGLADSLLATDQVADDPSQRSRAESLRAERQAENLGRIAGATRSEIRELLASLKSVKPGADEEGGKPCAAANQGLEALLLKLRATGA
jgi:ATP-dependent Clp protease, protease subunit